MKNIVVISPYDGDGKTTMIETIVGSPLQWYVSDVSCEYLTGPIMHADIQYSGMQFRIFEIPAFKEKLNLSHFYAKENPDPKTESLTNLLTNADLVIEVHDSTKKLILETLNDFFEQKVDGKWLDSDILYSKKMVVMTKKDLPNELLAWYNGLTEKEKEEYDKREGGNPNFKSYLAGALYDYSLCEGLYLATAADEECIFELSIKDAVSIQNLRNALYKFFRQG